MPLTEALGEQLPPIKTSADISDLVSKVGPSVVTVIAYGEGDQPLDSGTGFFIAPGCLVTSRHLVEHATRGEIRLASGNVVPIAGLLAEDESLDVVLLSVKVNRTEGRLMRLSPIPAREGQPIVVIDSTMPFEHIASEGIISSVRNISGIGEVIQIKATVRSSGCPVLDMQGRVVALAKSQMVERQSLNFALPSSSLLHPKVGRSQTFAAWSIDRAGSVEPAHSKRVISLSSWIVAKYEESKHLRRAAEAHPEKVDLWLLAGSCLDEIGLLEDEVDAYQRAIHVTPDSIRARYNLGVAYGKLGRTHDAIETFEHLLRIAPQNTEAFYNLGVAYAELGRLQDAVESYKEAVRIKPEFDQAQ